MVFSILPSCVNLVCLLPLLQFKPMRDCIIMVAVNWPNARFNLYKITANLILKARQTFPQLSWEENASLTKTLTSAHFFWPFLRCLLLLTIVWFVSDCFALFSDSPKWTQKSWRESVSWSSLSKNFADDYHHRDDNDDDGQDGKWWWRWGQKLCWRL